MFSLPYLYPGRYFAICVMRGEDGEMKTADPEIVLTISTAISFLS